MGMFDRFVAPPTGEKFAGLVMTTLRKPGETRQANFDKCRIQIKSWADALGMHSIPPARPIDAAGAG